MTISFELSGDFLDREGITLSVDDLKFGLERGWVSAEAVIDQAVRGVELGDGDPVLLEVASLLRDQADEVPHVLARLDSPDHVHDPRQSKRKWLYFQLKAAYDCRLEVDDPLGVVEQIYADFDYPTTVENFVRYMPLGPGDQAGEAEVVKRWDAFLRAEHEALTVARDHGRS
jgi:hypothetical protein